MVERHRTIRHWMVRLQSLTINFPVILFIAFALSNPASR